MKVYLIEMVTGFAFGVALAMVGFPYSTWQFWLLMVGAAVWRSLPKESSR